MNCGFSTYVSTPPTGLVVSLAEAKHHLHVDDTTIGARASVVFGAGDAQLTLRAALEGSEANSWKAELVASDPDQALAVNLENKKLTITLATDGTGTPTSTVNDVVAMIAESDTIDAIIKGESGNGNGTGVLEAAPETSFTGGVDGTSYDDAYITTLIKAVTGNVETILRKKLLTQSVTRVQHGFPRCRHINLNWGPVQEVTSIKYLDENGEEQTYDLDAIVFKPHRWPQSISLPQTVSAWPNTLIDSEDAVTIEYVTGYGDADAIPAEIKLAMLLLIGHYYSNRENEVLISGLAASVPLLRGAKVLLWPHRDFRF